MSHLPNSTRYRDPAFYRRCGRSGLMLPALSFGLWQNFGDGFMHAQSRALLLRAFDLGITHFDLANNYGTPAGSAEETFGRVLKEDLSAHRDELLVSTKAGYDMWAGPYGNFGSRKHLVASIDQSLRRLGVDYVDIFYHHRPDAGTPLDETMGALAQIVRSGKALYLGLSNYTPAQTAEAVAVLRGLGTPCLIHQPRYNMFERGIENGLTAVLQENGIGSVVFCPLAQGLLTNRYLAGIPADSRAGQDARFFARKDITEEKLTRVRALEEIARQRGQSLAQFALVWVLRNPVVTSAIIGASKVSQLEENVRAFAHPVLSPTELAAVEAILGGA